MITIPDALNLEHIELDVTAATPEEAVAEVAGLLRHDPRVLDWTALYESLRHHTPCRIADAGDFSICLPHARTAAVTELAMSAGRIAGTLQFPGARFPVRYIFCIGAPKALAGDYLRVAGALMRIFSDPQSEALLRTATTRQEFLEVLGAGEMKL